MEAQPYLGLLLRDTFKESYQLDDAIVSAWTEKVHNNSHLHLSEVQEKVTNPQQPVKGLIFACDQHRVLVHKHEHHAETTCKRC